MAGTLSWHLKTAIYGDYDVAERALRRTWASLEKVTAVETDPLLAHVAHDDLKISLDSLADLLTQQGKKEEARPCQEQMKALAQKKTSKTGRERMVSLSFSSRI